MPYTPSENQYATTADLVTYGMSAQALSHPSTGPAAQNAALLAASEMVDGYLRQQFTLPLLKWGADIVRNTCYIAAFDLVQVRGYNPEASADQMYESRNAQAIGWLRDVSKGIVSPDVTDSSPNSTPGKQAPAAAPGVYSPAPINGRGGNTRGTNRR